MIHALTSPSNPRIRAITALKDKKHRQESGLFWLEGAEFVTRALGQGWHADEILALPQAVTPQTTITTSTEALQRITGKTNPQPVLGVFRQRWEDLPTPGDATGLILALDRPRDPGNLGTILRTAEAAGVGRIILIGESTDPFAPECVRATMGSLIAAHLTRCTESEFLTWQQQTGATVIGTHLQATHDYRQLPTQFPTVLLMGNESEGLPEKLTAACTHLARIPMHGNVESLNLATATALMLYQLQRANLT